MILFHLLVLLHWFLCYLVVLVSVVCYFAILFQNQTPPFRMAEANPSRVAIILKPGIQLAWINDATQPPLKSSLLAPLYKNSQILLSDEEKNFPSGLAFAINS